VAVLRHFVDRFKIMAGNSNICRGCSPGNFQYFMRMACILLEKSPVWDKACNFLLEIWTMFINIVIEFINYFLKFVF
jgi:hypothetical protein